VGRAEGDRLHFTRQVKLPYSPLIAVDTRMAVTVAFWGMRDWAWLQESTSEMAEL
jgi:hypothetical protein